MSFFPPIMHGPQSGRWNGRVLLCRLSEFAEHLSVSTFHRAVLRTSADPAAPVVDHVTVLQQMPTCIVLLDYDGTLAEVDAANLHPVA